MTKDDLTFRLSGAGTGGLGRLSHAEYDANVNRQNYWSSAWAAGTYEIYEQVNHLGNTYICVVASTTTEPGTAAGATDWQRILGSDLNYTDLKAGNYQAIAGEIVQVNAVISGRVVTTPANPVQNQRFAVKIQVGQAPVEVQTGTATKIESHLLRTVPGSETLIIGLGRYAEWRYEATTDAWLATAAGRSQPYVEFWLGTPIVDISPVTIMQWTFLPLSTGHAPLLVTESGGVFTVQAEMDLSWEAEIHHEFISNANNSQAAMTIGAVPGTVAGTFHSFDLRDSMTAPRASLTEPFIRSGATTGLLIDAVAGDTFRFDATEVYSTSMSVNLDSAILRLSLA